MSTVGHVGDHADDALAGGAFASVARNQQLHNRIVYVPVRKFETHLVMNVCMLYAVEFYLRPTLIMKIR